MQIPLINEHLFCKYFVRLSAGNATEALLLMDVFILVLNLLLSKHDDIIDFNFLDKQEQNLYKIKAT